VLPLGDDPHRVVPRQPLATQDVGEGLAARGVDDQELVLVKLHLEGPLGVHHGDSRTAVVGQQVLEVPEHALEDRPLDPLPDVLAPMVAAVLVTRLEDHVAGLTERLEQGHEGLKEPFARNRGDDRRQPRRRAGVGIDVEPVALLGHDVEPPAGANCLGEREASVAATGEVGFEGAAVGAGERLGSLGLAAGEGVGEGLKGGHKNRCGAEETSEPPCGFPQP